MKQILRVSVILVFVFSTSNTRQCGPKTTKSAVNGYVTIRNIGVKMCQLKCMEHGACLNFEYNIETLTCRLSWDESKKTGKKAGYINLSKNHSSVPASPCASKTCSLGLRCLEAQSGKAVCVQDDKLDYPKKSPPKNIDQRERLNNNPLHDACRKGDLKQVRRILAHSVTDVDSRSKEKGWTPLMVAACQGHRVIYDVLISKGANASLLDYYGRNILHWACTGGHVDMVEHVLTQCNSRAKSGTTPLMNGHRNLLQFRTPRSLTRIAYDELRRMLDLSVGKGCRISSVDNSGKTILHLAAQNGRLEMVKHILSQNMIDINARDNDGDTAAMLAMSSGHCAVYDFLVLRGCPVT